VQHELREIVARNEPPPCVASADDLDLSAGDVKAGGRRELHLLQPVRPYDHFTQTGVAKPIFARGFRALEGKPMPASTPA
jgi:hypothetical protein